MGMYHFDTYMNKAAYRVATESGFDWVMKTLGSRTACFNMFRMSQGIFMGLHSVLVGSYGLKSTKRMSSMEALGLFLGYVVPLSLFDKLKIVSQGHWRQYVGSLIKFYIV